MVEKNNSGKNSCGKKFLWKFYGVGITAVEKKGCRKNGVEKVTEKKWNRKSVPLPHGQYIYIYDIFGNNQF